MAAYGYAERPLMDRHHDHPAIYTNYKRAMIHHLQLGHVIHRHTTIGRVQSAMTV
jgi:hypothetical protein